MKMYWQLLSNSIIIIIIIDARILVWLDAICCIRFSHIVWSCFGTKSTARIVSRLEGQRGRCGQC